MLNEIALKQIAKRGEVADVISFATNKSWGLGLSLYPVQRFMLKAMHGLEFEKEEKTISIWADHRKEEKLLFLTEFEYLQYLKDEGRISPTYEEGQSRMTTVMACGRRGSKSLMSSIVCSYNTYRLLRIYDPQEYYGLTPDSKITFTCVATRKDQAQELFSSVKGQLMRMLERTYPELVCGDAETSMSMYTRHDVETRRRPMPKIYANASPCTGRGLRGPSNIVVVLDEFAHFTLTGNNNSDSVVFDAVTPSIASFRGDGRVLAISSPLSKAGKFYDLHQQGMSEDTRVSKTILSYQAPTWEINENINPDFLDGEYHKDPDMFRTEYGAEWSGHSSNYIRDPQIYLDAVERSKGRPATQTGLRGRSYYMGIDIGFKSDSTALCVSHIEGHEIVIDRVEKYTAGEGEFEGVDKLRLPWIAQKINRLHTKFNIVQGEYDQWQGDGLEEFLRMHGINETYTMRFYQQTDNSLMYLTFRRLLREERLNIYDCKELESEMLILRQHLLPNHQIKVEAPSGCHDDVSDAVVRSVYLCACELKNPKAATISISSASGLHAMVGAGSNARGLTPGRISQVAYQIQRKRDIGQTKRHMLLEMQKRRGGRWR